METLQQWTLFYDGGEEVGVAEKVKLPRGHNGHLLVVTHFQVPQGWREELDKGRQGTAVVETTTLGIQNQLQTGWFPIKTVQPGSLVLHFFCSGCHM